MSEQLDPNETAHRHHNEPPLKERLSLEYAELLDDVEDIAATATALPKVIENDDQQNAVGDVVKKVTGIVKRAEAARVAEKEPYLKAGREIDGFFKVLDERLKKIVTVLGARSTEYLRMKAAEERRRREEEERARREEAAERMRVAEEAERLAREKAAAMQQDAIRQAYLDRVAAEKDAERALDHAVLAEKVVQRAERQLTATPGELARTRGQESLSTLKREWVCELLSREAVNPNELMPFLSDEVIEKAGRAAMKAGRRQLAGFRIYETESASFR